MQRTLRGGLAAAAILTVGLPGLACGSDDAAEPSGAPTSLAGPAIDSSTDHLIGPDEFAERIEQPDVVTINVHVPDEGNIAGTDEVIVFDQITESADLPADLDTPLAIYCRSGNMSADAVLDLQAMGYTDIVELEGGFNAWVAGGRDLEPPAS